MATKNTLAMLMLAALAAVELNTAASGKEIGYARSQYSSVTVRRTQVPSRIKVHDHRTQVPSRIKVHDHRNKASKRERDIGGTFSVADASKKLSRFKEWMIGANERGLVYPKKRYNLKGMGIRRFLQIEHRYKGNGVNIGWTNDASASTAKKGQWRFFNQAGSNAPIRYGEPVAILLESAEPRFLKYGRRTIGINLHRVRTVSYEWAILGGNPGEPVKRGQDLVVIYNLRHRLPLIYFDRTKGGDIGWPDSSRWGSSTITNPKFIADIRAAAKVLLMPGVPGGN